MRLAPVDGDDVDGLLDPLERLRPWLGQPERLRDPVERLDADEDLARSRGTPDARGDVDALTSVVRASPEGVSGVRADPHVRREDLGRERALDRDGGIDRRLRRLEGRKEAVARLLHDLATRADDRLTDELVVPGEQPPPLLVTQRVRQLRRVDDVGEEERAVCRLVYAEVLLRPLLVELRAQLRERRKGALELDRSAVLVAAAAE